MADKLNDAMKISFFFLAKVWEEALPVGNGKLGGMAFGLPYIERIQLNEDSVWYGGPQDRNNPSALEKLPEIRSLIMEGRIREAQELCTFALSGIPEEQRHYETLGNLYIEFDGTETEYSDEVMAQIDSLQTSLNEANARYADAVEARDEAIAQRLADYKQGLKAKIEKANKDLAEVKYNFKTN